MNALLHTLRTRWAVIALAVAAVAFVAGVNYGLRTGGGILAQGVTPTPTSIYDINTPTVAELDAAYATAVAENAPTAIVRVIDGNTGKPIEENVSSMSKEEAAVDAAYDEAKAKYIGSRSWPHARVDRLTSNVREYLATNPDRAIYLVKLDRVVHLPEGVRIVDYYTKEDSPPPILCSDPADGCPTTLPSYYLRSLGNSVEVDSAGHVFVVDSDIIPDGFSFLSEFTVWRKP